MKWIREKYHWVIALLAFLEMIVFGGLLNSASVFIIPITGSLEVTRGSYALALIPYTIMSTVSTLLSGILFQKLGYKRSTVLGLSIAAVSLLLTACCRTLIGFCLSKILLGLGYGVCFTAGAVRIVKDWFFKHQGLVVGAVSMSSGLGGSLMTLILTRLIEGYGWRTANVFLAVVIALVVLSYLLLMKNRPEEMGLQPYGFGILPRNSKRSRAQDLNWPGLSFQQWTKRPLLYWMTLSTLVSCTAIYLTSGILLPHFQDRGLSAAEAAGYQSMYMLVLAGAKLICGGVTDKVGPKPVTLFCLACGALGQILLRDPASPALCYIGIFLFGIASCMTSIMIPLLAAPMFGYRGIGGVNSVVLAMASLASVISSPVSNLVFDKAGTYTPVFWAAAVVNAILIIVYPAIFVMDKKEKVRLTDAL